MHSHQVPYSVTEMDKLFVVTPTAATETWTWPRPASSLWTQPWDLLRCSFSSSRQRTFRGEIETGYYIFQLLKCFSPHGRLRQFDIGLGRSGILKEEYYEVSGPGDQSLQCFHCNEMDRNYQKCPGLEPVTYPGSQACRLLALSDGTVVQQDVSPLELCLDHHITSLKRMIARKFGDGQASVICCFTDSCNESLEKASLSRDLVKTPISKAEMKNIVQKVQYIKRY